MNLVLAWVIYYGLIAFQGFKVQIPLLVEHDFVGVSQTKETVVIISNVASDSPASQVGIVQGDRIIAINDQFIENSEEFSNKIKETRIWGPSSKYSGQVVGLQHELKDLDVVEFKTF